MKIGAFLVAAKNKSVIQDAGLRTLGTAIIGAGLILLQNGVTLEEKALGVITVGLGTIVYIIKDVLDRELK